MDLKEHKRERSFQQATHNQILMEISQQNPHWSSYISNKCLKEKTAVKIQ